MGKSTKALTMFQPISKRIYPAKVLTNILILSDVCEHFPYLTRPRLLSMRLW